MQNRPGRKEREKALKIIHESFPFVVQRCIDGLSWESVEEKIGKPAAYERLRELDKKEPGIKWRVIPKNEADRLAEGVAIGKKMAELKTDDTDPRRKRHPAVYLPDNL